jgi:hypothetical protein
MAGTHEREIAGEGQYLDPMHLDKNKTLRIDQIHNPVGFIHDKFGVNHVATYRSIMSLDDLSSMVQTKMRLPGQPLRAFNVEDPLTHQLLSCDELDAIELPDSNRAQFNRTRDQLANMQSANPLWRQRAEADAKGNAIYQSAMAHLDKVQALNPQAHRPPEPLVYQHASSGGRPPSLLESLTSWLPHTRSPAAPPAGNQLSGGIWIAQPQPSTEIATPQVPPARPTSEDDTRWRLPLPLIALQAANNAQLMTGVSSGPGPSHGGYPPAYANMPPAAAAQLSAPARIGAPVYTPMGAARAGGPYVTPQLNSQMPRVIPTTTAPSSWLLSPNNVWVSTSGAYNPSALAPAQPLLPSMQAPPKPYTNAVQPPLPPPRRPPPDGGPFYV